MTNQDAINELQSAIDLIKQDGKDWLDERDIPILEMAISALQAQDSPKPIAESVQNVSDSDLISRKAAIDAIVNWAESHHENPDGDDCIMIILDVPSAQPDSCNFPQLGATCEDGDELDEAIRRLENISEYQSAEAERWDHSFDDYSGVKRDEYLKWSDEHRQLASWLLELKRLRTEVYFLKAERENAPVDLFGDLPCKTCRWKAETTEKCEECIDGITDNYEMTFVVDAEGD